VLGVGIALTASQFLRTSLTSYICVRVHPNKWQYKRIFSALLLTAICGGALIIWLTSQAAWVNLISSLMYSLLLLLLSWLYILSIQDRAQVKLFFGRIK
jgi:fucose permease